MASTAPTSNLPWSLTKIYVESYNQVNRMLSLALCLSDFGAIEIQDPLGILPAIQQNYQQLTITLIEEFLAVQRLEEGQELPDYEGNMVEIQEDYILELIDYGTTGKFCLASVIDPQSLFPFRYSKIILVYRPPDALSPIGELPLSWESETLNPAWGYPTGAKEAWKFPVLGDNLWHTIIGNIYNGAPTPHIRCFCIGAWSWLLTQQEAESGDIWNCFRFSEPADGGPWFSGMPRFISKGINDSWVESSAEIVARRGGVFDTIGTAVHWLHTHLGWVSNTDYRVRYVTNDAYLDVSASDQADSNTKVKRIPTITGGGPYGKSLPSLFTGSRVTLPGLGSIGTWKKR